MPATTDFLGYNPLLQANTVAEKLIRQRTSLGLSQKESAKRLGVDASTLAKWEQGKREPQGTFRAAAPKASFRTMKKRERDAPASLTLWRLENLSRRLRDSELPLVTGGMGIYQQLSAGAIA
jgi:transcriptional regulator with XRE-family HTH domain